MNQYSIYNISLVLLFLIVSTGFADELTSHYATIIYEHEEQLSQFNNRISINSSPDPKKSTKVMTKSDEVKYKVDSIVEKIEFLLQVFPRDLKCNVVLLTTSTEVQKSYKNKYGIRSGYKAFYSPQNSTVYVSVNDVDNYVLAHELTHMIIDHYFANSPPAIIQEILAHFVETHIEF